MDRDGPEDEASDDELIPDPDQNLEVQRPWTTGVFLPSLRKHGVHTSFKNIILPVSPVKTIFYLNHKQTPELINMLLSNSCRKDGCCLLAAMFSHLS